MIDPNLFPYPALGNIASFLLPMERAFFAGSNLCNCDTKELILHKINWDCFDIRVLKKSLLEKITDDDLASILLSIDARNTVKVLKLNQLCRKITGAGLRPLIGSQVIREIDLRLARHPSNKCYLDVAILVSILGEILEQSRRRKEEEMFYGHKIISYQNNQNIAIRSSLELIHFPQTWIKSRPRLLTQFLEIFNCDLIKLHCSECSGRCLDAGINCSGPDYGMNLAICSFCKQHQCRKHDIDDNSIRKCADCGAMGCGKCLKFFHCTLCDQHFCKKCTLFGDRAQCSRCSGYNCFRLSQAFFSTGMLLLFFVFLCMLL